jgi:hypothetical protein
MPARLAFGATFNPMRINAEQTALEVAAGAAGHGGDAGLDLLEHAFRATGVEFFFANQSLMRW